MLLLPLLILSVFLEGTVTTLPLVLVCLLCLTLIKRDAGVFPIAFVAGLVLDALRVHQMGSSSLFFIIFVLLILLYQRKYEINSYPFVFAASFLGSLGFLWMFGEGGEMGPALISAGIAGLLFMFLKFPISNFQFPIKSQ